MTTKLNWLKEAFSRDLQITNEGQTVGGMHRNLLERDVEAQLFDTRILFDVRGLLLHTVTIHDRQADNALLGTITFHFGKRAELLLANGDRYTWKRHNVLMREWDMIREGPDKPEATEVVSYQLTRQFFTDHGDIDSHLLNSPQANVVILTGLFIRNYFQRRRRLAAAAA